MHFRKTDTYMVFVECLKKISASSLKWSLKENGDLVCEEKQHHHDNESARIPTVEQVMKKLHLKLMPNEHTRLESADKTTITYTFKRKELLDQINAANSHHRFVMQRLLRMAEGTDKIRQEKKGMKA